MLWVFLVEELEVTPTVDVSALLNQHWRSQRPYEIPVSWRWFCICNCCVEMALSGRTWPVLELKDWKIISLFWQPWRTIWIVSSPWNKSLLKLDCTFWIHLCTLKVSITLSVTDKQGSSRVTWGSEETDNPIAPCFTQSHMLLNNVLTIHSFSTYVGYCTIEFRSIAICHLTYNNRPISDKQSVLLYLIPLISVQAW